MVPIYLATGAAGHRGEAAAASIFPEQGRKSEPTTDHTEPKALDSRLLYGDPSLSLLYGDPSLSPTTLMP